MWKKYCSCDKAGQFLAFSGMISCQSYLEKRTVDDRYKERVDLLIYETTSISRRTCQLEKKSVV